MVRFTIRLALVIPNHYVSHIIWKIYVELFSTSNSIVHGQVHLSIILLPCNKLIQFMWHCGFRNFFEAVSSFSPSNKATCFPCFEGLQEWQLMMIRTQLVKNATPFVAVFQSWLNFGQFHPSLFFNNCDMLSRTLDPYHQSANLVPSDCIQLFKLQANEEYINLRSKTCLEFFLITHIPLSVRVHWKSICSNTFILNAWCFVLPKHF